MTFERPLDADAAAAAAGNARVGGSDYAPPLWLRSPHVQTVLASSPWRRQRGARRLAETGAVAA